jgi:hypothetical protein
MPVTWKGPLSPDDPIFQGGVRFVLGDELPLDDGDEPEVVSPTPSPPDEAA